MSEDLTALELGPEQRALADALAEDQRARDGGGMAGEEVVIEVVERETVYESAAVRQLLTNFEVSDWGLLEQAAEHYGKNRRSAAHRNPGADAVLARGVYPRLEALARACRSMRRYALRDTEHGGRIVGAFPDV